MKNTLIVRIYDQVTKHLRSFMNFHSNFNDEDDVNTKSVFGSYGRSRKMFIYSVNREIFFIVCLSRKYTNFTVNPLFLLFSDD